MTSQKAIQIAFLLMLVLAVGMVTWELVPEPEPVYQGKSLSEWLLNYSLHQLSLNYNLNQLSPATIEAKRVETDIAVLRMGTNSVPTLLRLLRKRDSALLLHLVALAQKQHFVKIRHVPAEDWNNMAAGAFFTLGHSADYATPKLIKIYERNISPESCRAALSILVDFGPPAREMLPSLLWMAGDINTENRSLAIRALGRIHCEPELVLPVLVQTLHDPMPSIRASAAVGLGEFGPAAKQAVPALIETLKDQNSGIHDKVASALRSIDSEVAAKELSGETVEVP